MFLIILFFVALVLSSLKKNSVNIQQTLSSSISQSLRGISAVEIMLGHIGIATQSVFLYANRKAGILFVGIFFMLSGYGLIYSLNNKPNYINNFLKKRMCRIFFPAYIVYIVFLFIELCQGERNCTFISAMKYIFLGDFANGYRWYVVEIIGIYLVFRILYQRFSIHYANIIFLMISMTFTICAFILRLENPWYGSMLCFNVGLFYGEYTKEINEYFQRNFWLKNIFCIFITLLGIGGFFICGETFWGNVVFRNIASVFWIFWLISVLQKVSIHSPLSIFLGRISYEIYLVHPMVIILLKDISDPFLFSIICIIISLMCAWILHKIPFDRLYFARREIRTD